MVAAAQLGELLNGPQALPGRIAQGGVPWIEEPGVGLDAAAADATAQLIELGEAELMGVLNQDRVHPRDVQAALHDRGAEHQVRLAGVEGHHGALQFAFRHLTVGDQEP